MKLYIGDKVVNFDEKKYERLDNKKTKTNAVYRNGNEVIKTFKNQDSENEIFYRYFVDCNLDLELVSTPSNLAYDKKNNLVGSTSIYRKGLADFSDYSHYILDFNKNQLLNNLYPLQNDLDVLSVYNIIADDLRTYNCVFDNGKLYHVDYGSFVRNINIFDKNEKESFDDTKKKNEIEFNNFVENLFTRLYILYNRHFPKWISSSNNKLKFLEDNMSEQETVKQFIKKIQ